MTNMVKENQVLKEAKEDTENKMELLTVKVNIYCIQTLVAFQIYPSFLIIMILGIAGSDKNLRAGRNDPGYQKRNDSEYDQYG